MQGRKWWLRRQIGQLQFSKVISFPEGLEDIPFTYKVGDQFLPASSRSSKRP